MNKGIVLGTLAGLLVGSIWIAIAYYRGVAFPGTGLIIACGVSAILANKLK